MSCAMLQRALLEDHVVQCKFLLQIYQRPHSIDFPSVARINMGMVIEGIAHYLNHHIPGYQQVALITLADWTCGINNCVGLLDGHGLKHNFSQYYKRILAAWIIAQNTLTCLKPKCYGYAIFPIFSLFSPKLDGIQRLPSFMFKSQSLCITSYLN